MIEIAGWLIAFVTAVGVSSLTTSYRLQAGNTSRIQDAASCQVPQCADPINGVQLVVLAFVILFQNSFISTSGRLLSAILASPYWMCLFAAPIFPGTAFVDPVFVLARPRTSKIPAQLILIGMFLVMVLLAAVGFGFFPAR